ncbi:DUF938 domain-containing protein [Diaphorobacter sp. HDW4A]|uniref:DUF938 domain-containing protein n=1 Tax=Diaphorobacter sp. HDW4A TaxID=2714924 RepID=UPI00140DC5B0|nr:DUF938 domain-containing protein [Diaphorobacter sp. HDW4A]QIL79026.1 DUF938 domain-containing protein [Diaphorobacter sp. HDW4A]
MTPPFSQACANNQAPILDVLKTALAHSTSVLEIGSGTGQHSVFFAPRLPHLTWQASDLEQHHPGILAWHGERPSANLRAPVVVDLGDAHTWPHGHYDAVFTSNTAHIVSWELVQNLFNLVGQHLPSGGRLVIYGPFNYDGAFTSDSNRAFDAMLRQRDPQSGIRHFEDMMQLAQTHSLRLLADHAMPANNRTLVFEKTV